MENLCVDNLAKLHTTPTPRCSAIMNEQIYEKLIVHSPRVSSVPEHCVLCLGYFGRPYLHPSSWALTVSLSCLLRPSQIALFNLTGKIHWSLKSDGVGLRVPTNAGICCYQPCKR